MTFPGRFQGVAGIAVILSVCAGISCAQTDGAAGWSIRGASYHVAQAGSDTNQGFTQEMALRTIQAAARRMKPGDTCIIHAGTYRETVTVPVDGVPAAPVTFLAAPGESVMISGLDPVNNLERVDARTYRVAVGWDLGAGNQVFRDGVPLVEARWPNRKGSDSFNLDCARAEYEGSEFDRLRCTAFPDGWTAGALTGATVWCMAMYRWSSWTAPVSGYDPATRTLLVKGHNDWWVKENHNPGRRQKYGLQHPAEFFVSNARCLLDAPGEWFFDGVAKQLYFAVGENDDPNRSLIEVKRRQVAIDLNGRANVHIRGVQVFGATVTLRNSRNCSISGVSARYICHTRGGFTTMRIPGDEGIMISGRGNIFRDCEVAFSAGAGVTMHGESNALVNCFIHDTDTMGAYACCVNMGGAGHLVSHNTLRDTGRDCVQYAGGGHLIQYNDILRAGRICHDTGAVYQGGCDGEGTQICYNWVHEVNTGLGNGIYLDNYNVNYIVHHNVVWDISGNAIQVNHPGNYNMVFHNTVFGGIAGLYSPWKGRKTMFGTLLVNNLVNCESKMKTGSGYIEAATVIHAGKSPVNGFDPARDAISAGLDRGVLLPGVNDGCGGAAPDCGAYEAGKPLWRAGHDFSSRPSPVYAPSGSFYRNYLVNAGFSRHVKGVPDGWRVAMGEAEVKSFQGFNDPPADARFSVHGGSLCLGGAGESQVEQRVDGLKAGIDYVFAGYIRCEGAKDVVCRVRTSKGEMGAARYTASEVAVWRHVELVFKPAESGPVLVVITKEGAGTAYIDNTGLMPVFR